MPSRCIQISTSQLAVLLVNSRMDFDWVLHDHHWKFPIHEKIIPMLICPISYRMVMLTIVTLLQIVFTSVRRDKMLLGKPSGTPWYETSLAAILCVLLHLLIWTILRSIIWGFFSTTKNIPWMVFYNVLYFRD